MPLKLIPPKAGRSAFWRIRGTHIGVYRDRSTGAADKRIATGILRKMREDIECGALAGSREVVFASAAVTYADAGGEERYLAKIVRYFGATPLSKIDQEAIDRCATALYPRASAATRNRQVYSPISAVLKRAGVEKPVKRPKGWRGTPRLHWLRWEQALPLLEAATAIHPRFGALCTFLLYCGTRLSETLRLQPADLDLQRSYAYLRRTKNGEPQGVHLPPIVVAALAGLDLKGRTVFGLSRGGRLHKLLAMAEKRSGVTLPPGVAFHIFRHTYGAHMKGLGVDLLNTGRWKDRASTRVYEHVDVSEEARKADLLPTRLKA
jgi:integrase